MAVLFRYRVLDGPTASVRFGAACGPGCAGAVDVSALMTPARDAGWRTWKIKLSCLRAAGADMARITAPFTLTTAGRLSLEFTEARLTANDGAATCPAAR
jgi:beta-glucosidase